MQDAKAHVAQLARQANVDAIVQFVRQAPPYVQQDASIRELLAVAEQVLAERQRRPEVDHLMAQARGLVQQSKLYDALALLDRLSQMEFADRQAIAALRAEVQ